MKKTLLLLVVMLNVGFASKMYAVDGDQSHFGDWYYIVEGFSWVRVTDCDPIVNANIPEELEGYPVQQITGYYPLLQSAVKPFQNRTTLVTCTIPKTVTLIEDEVFFGCTSLRAIMVDEANPNYCSVDSVLYTKNLTKILRIPYAKADDYTLPNTITEITSSLFKGCTALPEINIPASVETIDIMAFADCAALTAINVDANNPNYCSIDGVLYNKDVTELIICPRGKVGTCKVPHTVTKIGMYAFANCSLLTSVEMIGSVEEIGGLAFGGCTSLQTMTCNAVTPPTQSWFMPTFGLGDTYPKVDTAHCTLCVPSAAISAYQADPNWAGFGQIEAITKTSDFLGDGTAIFPYQIYTEEEWNTLAARVAEGNRYENVYFDQLFDISVSAMVGDETHPFCGHYNGNEHTLTFNANVSENYAAPFRHVKGATIHSLVVDGSIATSAAYAGGLVSMADSALTVTDCRVSTALSFSGTDVKSGGIIGCANGAIAIDGCLYEGAVSGSSTWTNFGGFVWSQAADSAVTITNSLFAPAAFTDYGAEDIHPFVCGVNEAKTTLSGCYFYAPLSSNQGARTYALTGAAGIGIKRNDASVAAYDCSGLTCYASGIRLDDTHYTPADTELQLKLSGSSAYKASASVLSKASNYYTLTQTAEDIIIYGAAYPTVAPQGIAGLEYNGTKQTLITAGETESGIMFYYSLDGGPWVDTLPAVANAGDYYVRYKIIGDDTHADYEGGPAKATIAKCQSYYIERPTAIPNLSYNGADQALITPGEAYCNTIKYSYDNVNWSDELPAKTDMGNYKVYYKIEGDGNTYGVKSDTCLLTAIHPASIPPYEEYEWWRISVLASQTGTRYINSDGTGNAPRKLFDGETYLSWRSKYITDMGKYADRPKDMVVWKTDTIVEMVAYKLSPNMRIYTVWDTWTIYGGTFANDSLAAAALLNDNAWTIIDYQFEDIVMTGNATYEFACNNPGKYQYYRVVINALKQREGYEDNSEQEMGELVMGIRKDGPTGIDNGPWKKDNGHWRKVLRNGILLIEKDGKLYNAQGVLVESRK